MDKTTVGFNKPYMTGNELKYIKQAHKTRQLSGDGSFTRKCQLWLEQNLHAKKALLTQSCTSALEMAALLINVQPGDEIIMPSYTFVSTANAFALRGGVPVFVDIHPDTLNINEGLIEAAITSKTKAIVPVHYAGVSCEMDSIMAIAKKHHLFVIEDAAQAIMSTYKTRPIGSIGHLVAFSFHETKNIISGEGGALLINDESLIEAAEIIWEKGTDRKKFFRGEVDKYTWVSLGSSFLPSELTAAFLWAQLEKADFITKKRRDHWERYHHHFAVLEQEEHVDRPQIPTDITHNGHIYFLLLREKEKRAQTLNYLNEVGIAAIFHYVPLHSAPAGKLFGRAHGLLANTDTVSESIIRLPLYLELTDETIDYIAKTFNDYLIEISKAGKAA